MLGSRQRDLGFQVLKPSTLHTKSNKGTWHVDLKQIIEGPHMDLQGFHGHART